MLANVDRSAGFCNLEFQSTAEASSRCKRISSNHGQRERGAGFAVPAAGARIAPPTRLVAARPHAPIPRPDGRILADGRKARPHRQPDAVLFGHKCASTSARAFRSSPPRSASKSIAYELLGSSRRHQRQISHDHASRSGRMGDERGDSARSMGSNGASWPKPDGGAHRPDGLSSDAIRRNPDSRRLIVTLEPADVDKEARRPATACFSLRRQGPAFLPALSAFRRRLPRRAVQHRIYALLTDGAQGPATARRVHPIRWAMRTLSQPPEQARLQLSRPPRACRGCCSSGRDRSVRVPPTRIFPLEGYDPHPHIKAKVAVVSDGWRGRGAAAGETHRPGPGCRHCHNGVIGRAGRCRGGSSPNGYFRAVTMQAGVMGAKPICRSPAAQRAAQHRGDPRPLLHRRRACWRAEPSRRRGRRRAATRCGAAPMPRHRGRRRDLCPDHGRRRDRLVITRVHFNALPATQSFHHRAGVWARRNAASINRARDGGRFSRLATTASLCPGVTSEIGAPWRYTEGDFNAVRRSAARLELAL